MGDTRAELIRRAIIDKLGLGIEVYSSDDILMAAGIPQEEAEKLISQLQQNVDTLAETVKSNNDKFSE